MITGPENLQLISFIAGVILLALSILTALLHQSFFARLQSFPRSKVTGIILTAIALLWSAYMVNQMTLGELSRFKWLLIILTPLSFYFIIQYLDELLAPRALGGLLMLAPVLMLDAARWHPSSWRYTVIILAYIMILKGIWLMLCPFKFRIWTNAIFASGGKRNAAALLLAVCAVLLLVTGVKAG